MNSHIKRGTCVRVIGGRGSPRKELIGAVGYTSIQRDTGRKRIRRVKVIFLCGPWPDDWLYEDSLEVIPEDERDEAIRTYEIAQELQR